MSRRSSKRVEIPETELGSDKLTVTPKKGRKGPQVESTIAATDIETTSKAKANPKKQVIPELDTDDEPLVAALKQPATARKINRVRGKATAEEQEIPKQKTPAKRKVKAEDGADDTDRKTPKKRKTKEEKEAETMPLTARTVVATLKKAMHIGAHVSGAGGKFNHLRQLITLAHVTPNRGTKCSK